MNVAILLWDEVDLLSFSGAGHLFAGAGEGGAFHVYTVAETRRSVTSGDFLTIVPEYRIYHCPRPDVLVVPGGGAYHIIYRNPLLCWLREAAIAARAVLAISGGVDLLRAAGVPDIPDLVSTDSTGHAFVEHGKIVVAPTAGTAVEAALHVIARLHGEPLALDAACCADRTR